MLGPLCASTVECPQGLEKRPVETQVCLLRWPQARPLPYSLFLDFTIQGEEGWGRAGRKGCGGREREVGEEEAGETTLRAAMF